MERNRGRTSVVDTIRLLLARLNKSKESQKHLRGRKEAGVQAEPPSGKSHVVEELHRSHFNGGATLRTHSVCPSGDKRSKFAALMNSSG